MSGLTVPRPAPPIGGGGIARIAAGVDGYPEGRDAVAVGAAIAGSMPAELMLVAVHPDPLVVLPDGMNWTSLHKEAERVLREVRASLAPNARIVAETDLSVPRALQRVVRREHRDLLVLGSSREGPEGRVRMGKSTRTLVSQLDCSLAVAPRGIHALPTIKLRKIGVGFDGRPESKAALGLAASVASAASAELQVRAVVDDRVPVLVRSALRGLVAAEWTDVISQEHQRLYGGLLAATDGIAANVSVEVLTGSPAQALLALSSQADLLVIGSRRWGPAARVLLGSTGEMLLHDAACPVLVVPRPAS